MRIQHNSNPYQCLTSWQRYVAKPNAFWLELHGITFALPTWDGVHCPTTSKVLAWHDCSCYDVTSGKPRSRNSFVWVCCSHFHALCKVLHSSFLWIWTACAPFKTVIFSSLCWVPVTGLIGIGLEWPHKSRTRLFTCTWEYMRHSSFRLHRHHLHPRSCKFILLGWKRHNTITFHRAAWCISRALCMIPELDGSHYETSRFSMLILILSTSFYWIFVTERTSSLSKLRWGGTSDRLTCWTLPFWTGH